MCEVPCTDVPSVNHVAPLVGQGTRSHWLVWVPQSGLLRALLPPSHLIRYIIPVRPFPARIATLNLPTFTFALRYSLLTTLRTQQPLSIRAPAFPNPSRFPGRQKNTKYSNCSTPSQPCRRIYNASLAHPREVALVASRLSGLSKVTDGSDLLWEHGLLHEVEQHRA